MKLFVQRCVIGISLALGLAGGSGVAVADPAVMPFQINPAPFGNPNGSFDAFPGRCAVVFVEPGSVVITGANARGWGCYPQSHVRWWNITTGATGYAQLGPGLNGFPPAATLTTGAGTVGLMLTSASGGPETPGFATFTVS
ncbi:hypothetical protein [Nocardia camponoti]|uniref:Secreted protein n=1 Tax=Nocardia camponoti TaxID=1616106 RepID=A0A917V822_9NOCA|nr:hypothetical protein [Nocardia camponoti]GGK47824.1 hypothetical protein GCM10011591_18940 [Nocardia camponoti]